MSVSVIICSYGIERIHDVVDAENSIYSQDYKDFEVIIVIDDDKILLRELKKRIKSKTKILVSPKKGLSNARNIGINGSKYDIVVFLDDDAVARSRLLTTIIENFKDPYVAVVGGKIIPFWIDKRPIWFPEEVDWIVGCTYKGHPEKKGSVRNVIGCNMAFRKEVFNKVGLFETCVGRVGKKLLAGEEMEICVRIKKALPNSNILYDPNMEVYHKVHSYRQTLRYVIKRAFNEGLSKAKITKYFKKERDNEFITESRYGEYLLKKAIPSRLKNVIKMKNSSENIAKIFVIICVIFAVTAGYGSKYIHN